MSSVVHTNASGHSEACAKTLQIFDRNGTGQA